MGGKAWYGGVVRAVAADGTRSSRPECDGAARALYVSHAGPCPAGTATLEYEDGDIEESVPRDFIRPLDRAPPTAAAACVVGGVWDHRSWASSRCGK